MCRFCGKLNAGILCDRCAETVRQRVKATDDYFEAGGLNLWSADSARGQYWRSVLAEYDSRKETGR